jgi:hypothetical protein
MGSAAVMLVSDCDEEKMNDKNETNQKIAVRTQARRRLG